MRSNDLFFVEHSRYFFFSNKNFKYYITLSKDVKRTFISLLFCYIIFYTYLLELNDIKINCLKIIIIILCVDTRIYLHVYLLIL